MNINKSNEDNVGKMPVQVPNTLTSAWLDYSFRNLGIPWLRGLGIGGGVRYVGRVFNDEQNTSSTPAFTLFDATLRYEYGSVLFTLNASNVFNNKYIASTFFNRNYLGTERTVVGTMAFRF
jgi:iron complex outermembrane receptor protein